MSRFPETASILPHGGDADSPSLNNPCRQQQRVVRGTRRTVRRVPLPIEACLSSVACRARDLARPLQAALLPDSGNCEARHRIAFLYLRLDPRISFGK